MASLGAGGPTNLTVQPDQRRDLAPIGSESGYGGYGTTKGGRELSLSLLWRVAMEWRWLILAAIGVGIAGAVLVTLLTPLKYRSTASIELTPPDVEILTGEDSKGGRQRNARSDASFIGTQLALLSSRALAERVAQNLNLAAEPSIVGKGTDRSANTQVAAGFVQGGTQVQLQPQSMIVRVSFVARDPQIAARVANGITDAYIATNLERRYQSSSYARDFLQRQIARTRRDLEGSERQLMPSSSG
jgi:succinoglycan biosynthesis transport protein ExoP